MHNLTTDHSKIAIIDIGSNSIRLAIYEYWERMPHLLFSTKKFCALAENLTQQHFIISEAKQNMAYETLTYFAFLLKNHSSIYIKAVATHALRSAKNGQYIKEKMEKILQCPIDILSGSQEAYYAGLSIISFFDKPQGWVMDLGGGSVELAYITPQRQLKHTGSYPIGVLETHTHHHSYIEDYIKPIFEQYPTKQEQYFFLIGGAWRNLAKLYFAYYQYSWRFVHHFTIRKTKFLDFLEQLQQQKIDDIQSICHHIISKKRYQLLPQTITICQYLLKIIPSTHIVFSSSSIRDGLLFDMVTEPKRIVSPLYDGIQQLYPPSDNILYHSSYDDCLKNFCYKIHAIYKQYHYIIFEQHHIDAVVYLCNITQYDHPDYRAKLAFERIAYGRLVGVTHQQKLLIALAVAFRYKNAHVAIESYYQKAIKNGILTQSHIHEAMILGYMMRFVQQLTGNFTNHHHEKISLSFLPEKRQLTIQCHKQDIYHFIAYYKKYYQKICEILNCTSHIMFIEPS